MFLVLGALEAFRGVLVSLWGHISGVQSYRFSCRDKNIGWRLDYCLASPDLQDSVKEAFIRRHIRGSDHAPVGVVLATKPASGQ